MVICLKVKWLNIEGVIYLDLIMYGGGPLWEFIPGRSDPVFSCSVEKKSVTGPLSRFLHCSDIWCPVCARMPPPHSGVCFWHCTWILCSSHTPTQTYTQTIACHTCIDTHIVTEVVVKCLQVVTRINTYKHNLPLQAFVIEHIHAYKSNHT